MGRSAKLKAWRRKAREQRQQERTWTRADMKDEAKNWTRVTPEGQALGAELVRLTAPVIQRLAAEGEPDTRCASCAFRLGTVPNGCPQTVLDAAKAAVEGAVFLCHLRLAEQGTCHGWYAARVALRGREGVLPFAYSHDREMREERP